MKKELKANLAMIHEKMDKTTESKEAISALLDKLESYGRKLEDAIDDVETSVENAMKEVETLMEYKEGILDSLQEISAILEEIDEDSVLSTAHNIEKIIDNLPETPYKTGIIVKIDRPEVIKKYYEGKSFTIKNSTDVIVVENEYLKGIVYINDIPVFLPHFIADFGLL